MIQSPHSQWNLSRPQPDWIDQLFGLLQLIGTGVLVGFGMTIGIWLFIGLSIICGGK